MSTTLTAEPQTALIPAAQMEEVVHLDNIVRQCGDAISKASDITRAFIQARAILAIEKAITPSIFKDIKELMNTPIGFKTDRPPGAKRFNKKTNTMEELRPYPDKVVKQCLIVALLGGATIDGNQFNIIAGQTYFTKEFMQERVLKWPGLTNFKMSISTPMKHGEKTAAFSATASWELNGKPHKLEFLKTEVADMRIVVNSYGTSGSDQLIGLCESKVLRRVVKVLTGMNFGVFSDHDLTANQNVSEDGEAAEIVDQDEALAIEHEKSNGLTEFWKAAKEVITASTSIIEIDKFVHDRKTMIEQSEWDESKKAELETFIVELAGMKKQEIRDSRGSKSWVGM